jgi:hypothetical protein
MPQNPTISLRHSQLDYWKLAVAVLLTWYYLSYANGDPTRTYANWNFIDSADLVIHEGGHVIFSFFGEFIHVLGGSLTQVALPCIFASYFFLQRKYFSGSVLLFWVAQNILYVATYMGDSIAQRLPLLGGDGGIHDWNYLFTHTGLLQYTVVICASLLCLWFSLDVSMHNKVVNFLKN